MALVRTPQFITPQILALCVKISPAARPAFIRINPMPDAEPNDCFAVVRRKVNAEGGRIQFGWSVGEWPNVFIEAEHHAVYVPSTGPPWIDVTPSAIPGLVRRLFLPDDLATYDFENEGVRRNNLRKALVDDQLIDEFVRLADENNEILNTIPGVGAVALEGDVALRFNRNLNELASIEFHLAMKYTPQNAPCFCDSGQKFKSCHGQARRGAQ